MNQHSLNNADREFCQCLYENLYPLLLKRAIAILHDDDVARDIVQETFIALFGKTAKLRGMTLEQQAAYAVTAVKNNALKYIKKYQSCEALVVLGQKSDITDDTESTTGEDSTLKQIVCNMGQAELWDVLAASLSDREQRILKLVYIDNLSDQETAAYMGIKYATFRKEKSRARQKAKRLLGEAHYE